MKTAEEEAREMAKDPFELYNGEWSYEIRNGETAIHVPIRSTEHGAKREVEDARALLAWLISRSRAEGAAAERERLAAHAERPADEVAKEMVISGIEAVGWDDVDSVTVQLKTDQTMDLRDILSSLITRERAAAYAKGKADGELEAAAISFHPSPNGEWTVAR